MGGGNRASTQEHGAKCLGIETYCLDHKALPFTSYAFLGKPFNLTVSLFPCLKNGNNGSTYLKGLSE